MSTDKVRSAYLQKIRHKLAECWRVWVQVSTYKPCRIIQQIYFRLDRGMVFHYTYANGKEVPLTLPYNTAGLILKGKHMQATIDNTLSALIQRAEVRKNIEAEAQRKAKIAEHTARAMDRANREWR